MIFEQIRTGGDRNFAYLVGDESTKKAAVLDPSYVPGEVLERAKANGLEVALIVNTHLHHDHVNGNLWMIDHTDAELIAGSPAVGDGDTRSLGEITLTFLHTPGHTAESMCILAKEEGAPGKLITGDTLFVGKVGGTDLGEGARQEYDSLHNKIMTLPEETEIWPGHDYGVQPSSTVADEKKTNPFILQETFEAFVELKKNWAEYKKKHNIR